MKLKIKDVMLALLLLAVPFWGLVSCSDDDGGILGPVAINSCQCTATTVTPIWTLVPNDNCDGYIITLYLGTRENLGEMVEQLTFDHRTCQYTFTGLTPDTDYVICTHAIPSASSGFSDAQLYWKEFTTLAAEN